MGQEPTSNIAGQEPAIHADALELATLLRPSWPAIRERLHATGVPLCEGEDDGDDNGDDDNGGGNDDSATFDREYVEKLRRENAAARKRAQEAESRAKEYEDRDKSEQQKLTEQAAADAQRADAAERELMKFRAAAAKGLPAKHAHRISGTTQEQMEQDAAELAKEFGGQQRTSFDGGTRERSHEGAGGMDAAIRRAAGRSG